MKCEWSSFYSLSIEMCTAQFFRPFKNPIYLHIGGLSWKCRAGWKHPATYNAMHACIMEYIHCYFLLHHHSSIVCVAVSSGSLRAVLKVSSDASLRYLIKVLEVFGGSLSLKPDRINFAEGAREVLTKRREPQLTRRHTATPSHSCRRTLTPVMRTAWSRVPPLMCYLSFWTFYRNVNPPVGSDGHWKRT